MASEIERKFLVIGGAWRSDVERSIDYRQGYLATNELNSVRIRIGDGRAHLNIKSATKGIERLEFEYEIPLGDARGMLDELCAGPLVEKTRHLVRLDGKLWEIDVFAGDNEGLVVAEVELDSLDEAFTVPKWAGRDVSTDVRFFNACLVDRPFSSWSTEERQAVLGS